jgi:hypothetical protein
MCDYATYVCTRPGTPNNIPSSPVPGPTGSFRFRAKALRDLPNPPATQLGGSGSELWWDTRVGGDFVSHTRPTHVVNRLLVGGQGCQCAGMAFFANPPCCTDVNLL